MPVYEYWCDDCGPFEALGKISAYDKPCSCPECGTEAPRVMMTAPNLATMDSNRRNAHATNERAADSPKRSTQHGPNCGCCGGGTKKKSKTLYRPDGSKSFPTKRPWMISH
ncbi:zinc ribbon domain-containing protein [Epibacterium ulvae]|uniref:FmdB family zinc ribbon protein n=1 Tax=Epibacterium ulvae TaxID=1156985 RepID=UPI001BFC3E76|nr:zinc ribbon domain-containing protein [Epibacterium ulvae]MBT8153053.1 zinc ribbon domain-containing protein [Epibacterium ulvae]